MKKLVRQETTYYDNFDLKEFKEYYDNTLTTYERYDERRNQIFFADGKGFTMEKTFKANISDYGAKLINGDILDYYKDTEGVYYECFYFPRETMEFRVIKCENRHYGEGGYMYHNVYYQLVVTIINQDHGLNDFKLKCRKHDENYPWVIENCTGKMTLYRSRNHEKMLEILKDKLDITSEIWESNNYKLKFTF